MEFAHSNPILYLIAAPGFEQNSTFPQLILCCQTTVAHFTIGLFLISAGTSTLGVFVPCLLARLSHTWSDQQDVCLLVSQMTNHLDHHW